MQLRGSTSTLSGGAGSCTQPKPAAPIAFIDGRVGHHSVGTESPKRDGSADSVSMSPNFGQSRPDAVKIP